MRGRAGAAHQALSSDTAGSRRTPATTSPRPLPAGRRTADRGVALWQPNTATQWRARSRADSRSAPFIDGRQGRLREAVIGLSRACLFRQLPHAELDVPGSRTSGATSGEFQAGRPGFALEAFPWTWPWVFPGIAPPGSGPGRGVMTAALLEEAGWAPRHPAGSQHGLWHHQPADAGTRPPGRPRRLTSRYHRTGDERLGPGGRDLAAHPPTSR